MSPHKHLIKAGNRFYYRAKVPTDLTHLIPSKHITRSLRTDNLQDALTLLFTFECRVQSAFSVLRTGTLPHDLQQEIITSLAPKVKNRSVSHESKLSQVISLYTEEKKTGWTDKTTMEVNGIFKLLLGLIGDIDITQITRPMLVDLRSDLLRVPRNFYVTSPGQSLRSALSDLNVLSVKTVNKHMARIGSLFRYCHEQGIIPINPATSLQIPLKQRSDEERSAYSLQDISNMVVNLPLDLSSPERYWIPLIGLYSGLRLNEVCQLYCDDIVSLDGFWCFDINGKGDKRIKNSASERVIPIHPKLIEPSRRLSILGKYSHDMKQLDIV